MLHHYKETEKSLTIAVLLLLLLSLSLTTIAYNSNKLSLDLSTYARVREPRQSTFQMIGGGRVQANQEFKISVAVNVPTSYNAMDLNVAYKDITFVRAEALNELKMAVNPIDDGSKVNIVVASLGTPLAGTTLFVDLYFKAPASGMGIASATGTVALMDEFGTKLPLDGNKISVRVSNK
jgi:hypothetical protein